VLGFPFMPKGPYVPFFTITAALTGMIPAFVFSLKDSRTLSLPHLFVSILLGQAITKVALVPYFQNLVFAWPFLPNALASVIVEMVHVPLYTSMAFPMLRAFASGDCQMTFHPRQALPLQPGCIDEIPGAIHDDRSVR